MINMECFLPYLSSYGNQSDTNIYSETCFFFIFQKLATAFSPQDNPNVLFYLGLDVITMTSADFFVGTESSSLGRFIFAVRK